METRMLKNASLSIYDASFATDGSVWIGLDYAGELIEPHEKQLNEMNL